MQGKKPIKIPKQINNSSINLKIVFVGNGAVGKTSTQITYETNSFPEEYTPTFFGSYSTNVIYKNLTINLNIWDTVRI